MTGTERSKDSSPKASLEEERARQKDKADKAEQDDYLEESLEETFPASDPIAPGQPDDRK